MWSRQCANTFATSTTIGATPAWVISRRKSLRMPTPGFPECQRPRGFRCGAHRPPLRHRFRRAARKTLTGGLKHDLSPKFGFFTPSPPAPPTSQFYYSYQQPIQGSGHSKVSTESRPLHADTTADLLRGVGCDLEVVGEHNRPTDFC